VAQRWKGENDTSAPGEGQQSEAQSLQLSRGVSGLVSTPVSLTSSGSSQGAPALPFLSSCYVCFWSGMGGPKADQKQT